MGDDNDEYKSVVALSSDDRLLAAGARAELYFYQFMCTPART